VRADADERSIPAAAATPVAASVRRRVRRVTGSP
jgi:hypothetical protein